MARPTFFEHFDSVVLDWRYLRDREKAALQQQARWIERQGLRVLVDASSGVNLYPALRLLDNLPGDYNRSMAALADVLAKMNILGARDLILSLHRYPENNFTSQQTQEAFEKTLRRLATEAEELGITLHLRMAFGKPPWNLGNIATLIEKVGAGNLRMAASTALLLQGEISPEAAKMLETKLGLWLLAAPQVDVSGTLWNAHGPLHRLADRAKLAEWLALAPHAPVVMDAVFANQDEEYLDAIALQRLHIRAQ